MPDLPILGAALGIDHIEALRGWLLEKPRDVEIQTFSQVKYANADVSDLIARAKTLLDGHSGRLGIHGPFRGFTIASGDPDIREVVKRRLDKALDICAGLGADQMVVHSHFSPWVVNRLHTQFLNRVSGKSLRAMEFELCHLTLRDAVKRAEDMGVVIVIENVEDHQPHDRQALAESFGSPAVAVSLDTGHAFYARTCSGAPPLDFYVAEAGHMLHHIHLQDVDGFADRHWSIGTGAIDWVTFFQALKSLDSNPRLILELKDKSKIAESAAYLEKLGLAQ